MIALTALGCGASDFTQEPTGVSSEAPAVGALTLAVVSGSIRNVPLEREPGDGEVVVRVENVTGETLLLWGSPWWGPVSRLATRSDGRWIEREPLWIECATGLQVLTLEPGESIDARVDLPSLEREFRVAIGCWRGAKTDGPSAWSTWDWVWSAPFVLLDLVDRSN